MNAREPGDRTAMFAGLGIGAVVVLAVVLGLFVVPISQGMQIGLTPWQAICRAVGIQPGSPAARQPVSLAQAHPVSDVVWSPAVLQRLSGSNRANGERIAAQVCSACHGEGGLSQSPQFPVLAGQSAAAIYKQLHDYASGARVHPLMTPVVRQLGELQMADVAAYFGGSNTYASLSPLAYQLAGEEGAQQLILRGDPRRQLPACNSCHGNHVGGPIETPTLAGQRMDYLIRQLDAYGSDQRSNDVFGRMRTIARKLTPQERAAIARAYQGTL